MNKPTVKLKPDINISLRALLAIGVFVVSLLALTTDAQFTCLHPAILAGKLRTYDGLGVDVGLNPDTVGIPTGNGDSDYIGTATGSGLLTVLSGTLTINASDFKVPNFGSPNTGTINVGANATFNINMVGLWSYAIAQGANGSMTISNGATVNYLSAGTNEQRFSVGNTGGGTTGALTILGGTLNINLNPTTVISDNSASFPVGGQGGAIGLINLTAGTLNDNMPLPFTLGGLETGVTNGGTPAFAQNTSISIMTISNGVFVMTNLCANTDPAKATFIVGSSSYVNFLTGGTGQLSLLNYQASDYGNLISANNIQVNGQPCCSNT